MKYRETDLKKIRVDHRFNLRAATGGDCPPDLRRSLNDVGLITPLLVLERNDELVLVHGHRRLPGLMKSGGKKAACLILDETTPLPDILTRLIEEHLVTGAMSPFNIAKLLNIARPLGEERQCDLLTRLGINPRHKPPAAFLALLELEPEARLAVDDTTIAPPVALSLFDLEPEARDLICRIIVAMKLSRSGQKGLLQATVELARRQKKKEHEIAADIWRQCALIEGNPPQKAAALSRLLNEKLYPRAAAAMQEFNAFVSRLELPKNAAVSHSPAFESDRVELKITFNNRNELARFWHEAGGICERMQES